MRSDQVASREEAGASVPCELCSSQSSTSNVDVSTCQRTHRKLQPLLATVLELELEFRSMIVSSSSSRLGAESNKYEKDG